MDILSLSDSQQYELGIIEKLKDWYQGGFQIFKFIYSFHLILNFDRYILTIVYFQNHKNIFNREKYINLFYLIIVGHLS